MLRYSPSRRNPFVANLAEVKRTSFSIFDLTNDMTQPDGTFRLVGFPGPGLVSAKAYGRIYRMGVGASDIPAMTKDGRYPTFFGFDLENANSMKEINPRAGTKSVTCDLTFDPGGAVRISLIDPAGKPVSPCSWCYTLPDNGGKLLLEGRVNRHLSCRGWNPTNLAGC